MNFVFHGESSGHVAAAPGVLFEHLDDPRRLASHMESGSAAMAGARMSIETDRLQGKAIGSVIRMRGRMLGLVLSLDEAVTEREPPRLKVWETLGEPQLLVIGAYRMGFRIEAAGNGSFLTVTIDYALPDGAMEHLLGRLFAPAYARWCCRRMVEDAIAAFDHALGTSAAP